MKHFQGAASLESAAYAVCGQAPVLPYPIVKYNAGWAIAETGTVILQQINHTVKHFNTDLCI